MGILRETFSNKDTALLKIEDNITGYYKSDYKDFYANNKDLIDNSVASVQNSFQLRILSLNES